MAARGVRSGAAARGVRGGGAARAWRAGASRGAAGRCRVRRRARGGAGIEDAHVEELEQGGVADSLDFRAHRAVRARLDAPVGLALRILVERVVVAPQRGAEDFRRAAHHELHPGAPQEGDQALLRHARRQHLSCARGVARDRGGQGVAERVVVRRARHARCLIVRPLAAVLPRRKEAGLPSGLGVERLRLVRRVL